MLVWSSHLCNFHCCLKRQKLNLMAVFIICSIQKHIEVRSARDEPTQGVKHWIGPTSPPWIGGGVAQPACSTWTWIMFGSFLQDEVIVISYYRWDKRPISLICTCRHDMSGASLQLTMLWEIVKFIPLYNYIDILYYINISSISRLRV